MKTSFRFIYQNLIKKYLNSFKKNITGVRVKKLDLDNFVVHLVARGNRAMISFPLDKIIFDQMIISSLDPYEAAIIGFYYGKNYKEMTNKPSINNSVFLLNITSGAQNTIISMDRLQRIVFVDNKESENQKQILMHPLSIISQKELISKFHPTHSCYIGILAGKSEKSSPWSEINSRITT